MNIQILDSHLREFLETKATAKKIGECLALCGPSVERVEPFGKHDFRYDIEITTNRVDTASVMGIAHEAVAILPQFGVKAKYKTPATFKILRSKQNLPLVISPNKTLNKRVMAVVIDNVKMNKTPEWMVDRLDAAGIRSKNILVDITNYVMIETGHPTHVFDYDQIIKLSSGGEPYLGFRLSKTDEKAMTFDGKTYKLPGSDIVIESATHEIIDLPGIIGTKNSVVNDNTKRIIFFIDNNDPRLMRKTSLALNIRTVAVQLNEKQVDPNLGKIALSRGIELYTKLAEGRVAGKVFDFYPRKYKVRTIQISYDAIIKKIGVEIPIEKVITILISLGFSVKRSKENLSVSVPSGRAHEVEIPEDIVEEVARIYGYHNLPSVFMTGQIPLLKVDPIFAFENKLKDILKGFGGYEVYTLSLVPQTYVAKPYLALKNPLGGDTEYLRTSLVPSLLSAAKENARVDKFHIFEIANVYVPQNGLPNEELTLAGVCKGYSYREVKGYLATLLSILHIETEFEIAENKIAVRHAKQTLGNIEIKGSIYTYEFRVGEIMKFAKDHVPFREAVKYPPQVEDITFSFETNVKIGDVIKTIKLEEKMVQVELKDMYKNYFTFTVWYQDKNKTLRDSEVAKIRSRFIKTVKDKFGGMVKE